MIREQLASASPELRASTFGALDKESCYLAPTKGFLNQQDRLEAAWDILHTTGAQTIPMIRLPVWSD